jgi:hypothetical protein
VIGAWALEHARIERRQIAGAHERDQRSQRGRMLPMTSSGCGSRSPEYRGARQSSATQPPAIAISRAVVVLVQYVTVRLLQLRTSSRSVGAS